jgi:ABC-2 type transport system permease protein
MNTFFQLIMVNIKETFRDKMALFWFVLFPVFFILLFGFIFSEENMDMNFPVGLVLDEVSAEGQYFRTALTATDIFDVHEGIADEEFEMLRNGKRHAVIIPGETFEEKMNVAVYYDATKQETTQVVIPILKQLLDEAERRISKRPSLFELDLIPIQRQNLREIDFLLPGILSMALMQLGLFGALRLVGLREQKILKSLGATPLNRSLLIGCEVLVRLAMAVLQTLAIVIIGYLVFNVLIVGNWFKVFAVVLLGAATFVSLGYLLVSFTRTTDAALAVIQIVQFPMMFLSGIFFPVTMMPAFIQPVIKAMPLAYLGDALRQIMMGYPGDYAFAADVGILIGWFLITLILTIRFWKWE